MKKPHQQQKGQQPALVNVPPHLMGKTKPQQKRTGPVIVPLDEIDRAGVPAELAKSGLADKMFGPRPTPQIRRTPEQAEGERPLTMPSRKQAMVSDGEAKAMLHERDAFMKQKQRSSLPPLPPLPTAAVDPSTPVAPLPAFSSGASPRAVQAASAPEGYRRIGLPSNFVPYDFDFIYVRPLRTGDLANLAAAMETNDYSAMLDALAPTLQGADVRDLTAPDFRSLMYWLRLNSYPRSPYTVEWKTRYGNDAKIRVKETDLTINTLKMTKAEYEGFKQQGIRFPTCRDAERQAALTITPRQRFMYERAQYVHVDEPDENGDWMAARVAALEAQPIEFLEIVREFAEKVAGYGVREETSVADDQFDPAKAVAYLREQAKNILDVADALSERGATPEFMLSQAESARDMFDEADLIEAHMKDPEKGEPYKPREEVIMLNINVMSFFPSV